MYRRETYSFGSWVLRRRKALDLTRDELAKRVGCATETIKKIERDERRPSRQIAVLLADALAVSPEEQPLFLQAARGERSVDRMHLAAQPLQPFPEQTHNLPTHLTSFIDRESELATIDKLLANPDCRLLTLVGPGGTGKTRLALRMAERKVDTFFHGVWFVSLAPLQSADHILPAIAEGIRFALSERGDPKAQLLSYLHYKELLLVLDNYEHLMDGATFITEILKTAPDIKVLVTSRERLNLQGEFTFKVEGLSYPINGGTSLKDSFSAVQLFVERACRMNPQLVFSPADHAAITRICRLVEGIPLAVELAAAWTYLLPCQEIAGEIEQSLGILAVSTRDIPERHRSMRAVFDHSWNLLSEAEQVVLRQLSVFRGGFTREAAEQVSGASLTILAALADKSLLQLDQQLRGTQRYDLHELVRQYANERLLEAGETDLLRERHLAYFLQLAERAEPELRGAKSIMWLERLETEHANLRAALAWSLENASSEFGLRLAGALGWFWHLHSHITEGREWLGKTLSARAVASSPAERPMLAAHAKALYWASQLALNQGDIELATARCEASLALARELGDRQCMAYALGGLGLLAYNQGNYERAEQLAEVSLSLFRELDHRPGLLHIAPLLAGIPLAQKDYVRAAALFAQLLALARELGDQDGAAYALEELGRLALHQGDYDGAWALLSESWTLFREAGNRSFSAFSVMGLGLVALHRGQYKQATAQLKESLIQFSEVNFEGSVGIFNCVHGLARVAAAEGSQEGMLGEKKLARAVRLFGAAEALFEAISDLSFVVADRAEGDRQVTTIQAQLDESTFVAACEEGRAMTMEQAIAYALEDETGMQRNAHG